jgi:hypothetical protein
MLISIHANRLGALALTTQLQLLPGLHDVLGVVSFQLC